MVTGGGDDDGAGVADVSEAEADAEAAEGADADADAADADGDVEPDAAADSAGLAVGVRTVPKPLWTAGLRNVSDRSTADSAPIRPPMSQLALGARKPAMNTAPMGGGDRK